MKILLFTIFLMLGLIRLAGAADLYVTVTGNDANDGRSRQTAFRSLQRAADVVQPGDVVWIGGGDHFSVQPKGNAVLAIKTSGTKDAWITWKAMPGKSPYCTQKAGAG